MIRRFAPFIVLAILVCILLWPVLIGGRILLPGGMLQRMSPWNASGSDAGDVHWNALSWDAVAYFYPARLLLGRAIKSGELPLWNPYQMCGTPFLADYQSAVLYPPNLLFAVLPPDGAFGLLAALHLFAAGSFTYVFLRGLGVRRAASTFGGIAFMLSGFAITWLELPVFLSTAIWLPLGLHFARLAHERQSVYCAAGAGIAVALSLLGGHPQTAFYCLMAVGLYWVYLGVSGSHETAVWRSFGLACLTFAVGFALAAPQLLPSAELARFSHRGGCSPTTEGYAAYSALAMPFRNLITLLAPDFFGNPSRGNFWGAGEYAEYCSYVGILALLLMPLAFAGKDKSRRHAWFFGGLAVLALLMALGTGVNRLFYFGVPGFARSGSPARVLLLFMFSIAVLGAVGLDRVLRDDDDRQASSAFRIMLSGLGMLVLGSVLLGLYLRSFDGEFEQSELIMVHLPAIWTFAVLFLVSMAAVILIVVGKLSRRLGGMLVIGILGADLLAFGIGYNPTCKPSEVYQPTGVTDFLKNGSDFSRIMPLNDAWALRQFPESVLPPNSATVYGLFDVQGYDSLYPVRYKALLDAAAGRDSCPPENGNMVFARNPASPVYDLLGVRWVISREPMSGKYQRLDGCYVSTRDAIPAPRAFLARAVEFADDPEILRRITQGEADPREAVLLTPEDGELLKPWWDADSKIANSPSDEDLVLIRDYSFNSVTLRVSASRAAVLVLTDQYYPGWKAYVDEQVAPIARADYAFRAIMVPPGQHTVRFAYEPRAFRIGAGFALLAFILLVGLAIHAVVRYCRGRA